MDRTGCRTHTAEPADRADEWVGCIHPMFGVPFFYQFKIPKYLSAAHATYIADGTYGGPYYRIDLHRRDNNNQHRRLKELAAINPNTFYAAPELNT